MKRTIFISTILFLLFGLFACSDKVSFSELQEREEKTIASYIKVNNIQVVSSIPDEWGENVYYKTASGLYFHLEEAGSEIKSISTTHKTRVGFRMVEYLVDENRTVISDQSNGSDSPYPIMITYGDLTYYTLIGTGIYETIGLMKNLYAKAKIIVPSSLNTSEYSDYAIPRTYDVKITLIE